MQPDFKPFVWTVGCPATQSSVASPIPKGK